MWEKLINFFLKPLHYYQERKLIKQRLKELRENDPFIYK
jgi:hypothetical protein